MRLVNLIQFPPEMDENWVRYGLAKLGQISRLPNWQRMLFCVYTTQLLHSTGEGCWNNYPTKTMMIVVLCPVDHGTYICGGGGGGGVVSGGCREKCRRNNNKNNDDDCPLSCGPWHLYMYRRMQRKLATITGILLFRNNKIEDDIPSCQVYVTIRECGVFSSSHTLKCKGYPTMKQEIGGKKSQKYAFTTHKP